MTVVKSKSALFALAVAAAVAVCIPGESVAGQSYAQLPQGDPKRKLMILHWQEVLLERMVKGSCFVQAGVEADRNRAVVYAARDSFERTLPDIEAEVRNLNPNDPTTKRLTRGIEKKRKQWFRFRALLDQTMAEQTPTEGALAQIALMEIGIVKYVDQIYKAVRRKMMKQGEVKLEDLLQEATGFQRVYLADQMVREACMVAMDEGGQLERLKLLEAVETFSKQLDSDEAAPAVPAEVKALVPTWRAILPEIRSLTEGQTAPADLLKRLESIKHEWSEASGEPVIGNAVG